MTLFTTQRPLLSVKATARFPANVTADTGLAVTKTSGTYNFGFDFTGLTTNTSLATPSEWWTLVYNDQTETYEQVRVDALVDYTIDTRRGIGDASDTLLSNDRYVELTASLTAARTWTLPAASSVTGGVHIIVQDAAGGINGSNTLTIQRAGSDTINGATSVEFSTAYDGAIFYSDGTSKWSYVRRPSTVTVASGKTVTFNNTLTFSGTDGSTLACGTGGTVAYTANKLSAFAATTSAELAGVISDETGSGALVFAQSPTLVTPALGTPASGTLTNCTGLPIATGVSGLGTGVATALAINVGSAGAPIVLNGALGTPSSGTLTNATGLPISTGLTGAAAGVLDFLATPSSANLKTAVTDETGSGGALVFATGPTLTGINIAAGTNSVAPINLTSGTNLTSATAGAVEYDGTCYYATPATSNRGVIAVEHFIILTSTNTLTNNTSAQPIFDGGGGPANGAITLPVGTYKFEAFYNLSGLNSGSKNIAFGFAGTATIGSIAYRWESNDTSAFDYGNVVTTASATNTVSGTLTAMPFWLSGIIRVTGSGTVIPQITQVTLSAAASVLVNSFISFKAIGSDTVASLGNVS